MCGNDTFAIAVSSNSMNVASVTVIAMNHGFIAGLALGRLHELAGVNLSLIATCPAFTISMQKRPFGRIYSML
jgi:hypothetical protein